MNKQIAWVVCLIVSFAVSTSLAVASENCTELSTDFQFCQGLETEATQDRWHVHLTSEADNDSLAKRLSTEFGSADDTPLLIAGISNIFLTHAKNFQTGFIFKAESFAEPIDGKQLAGIVGAGVLAAEVDLATRVVPANQERTLDVIVDVLATGNDGRPPVVRLSYFVFHVMSYEPYRIPPPLHVVQHYSLHTSGNGDRILLNSMFLNQRTLRARGVFRQFDPADDLKPMKTSRDEMFSIHQRLIEGLREKE